MATAVPWQCSHVDKINSDGRIRCSGCGAIYSPIYGDWSISDTPPPPADQRTAWSAYLDLRAAFHRRQWR